jgi:hypothetical protein
MIAFIAHTAPDDNIPSKNHPHHNGIPNNVIVGENTANDKNQPPWKPKHIAHDNIPDMK